MILFARAMIVPCFSASTFSSRRAEAAGIDPRVRGSIKDAGEVVDLQTASPVIDGESLEIGSCIGTGSQPKVADPESVSDGVCSLPFEAVRDDCATEVERVWEGNSR